MTRLIAALLFVATAELYAAEIVVPSIPDLEVTREETVPIPGAESAIVHQFEDGRIIVTGSPLWRRK